jgi:hypothetical protein
MLWFLLGFFSLAQRAGLAKVQIIAWVDVTAGSGGKRDLSQMACSSFFDPAIVEIFGTVFH